MAAAMAPMLLKNILDGSLNDNFCIVPNVFIYKVV